MNEIPGHKMDGYPKVVEGPRQKENKVSIYSANVLTSTGESMYQWNYSQNWLNEALIKYRGVVGISSWFWLRLKTLTEPGNYSVYCAWLTMVYH